MSQVINKILLFGSTGMLGSYIYTYFLKHTNIPIISIDFRITNENLYYLEDTLIKYDLNENTCVINCIGLIPQRKYLNGNNNEYFLINSIFPQILSTIGKKYGSKIIFPTTDCVFSGKRENGNYTEDDLHDETNLYGVSKSSGEPFYGTIIRTSIIGREKYNKKSLLEWIISKQNSEMNGWDNHYWNGITCLEYSKVIYEIIKNNLFWNGVRHIFSPESVSKYEIAVMVNEIFELNIKINKNKYEEIVNKTLNSKYFNIFNIKNLYEQIKDLKNFELI